MSLNVTEQPYKFGGGQAQYLTVGHYRVYYGSATQAFIHAARTGYDYTTPVPGIHVVNQFHHNGATIRDDPNPPPSGQRLLWFKKREDGSAILKQLDQVRTKVETVNSSLSQEIARLDREDSGLKTKLEALETAQGDIVASLQALTRRYERHRHTADGTIIEHQPVDGSDQDG